MAKQINVVGAVIIRDGLILCARRGLDGALPGLWEFPGGKIEADETPIEALKREIQEELVLDVTVGEQVAVTSYEYPFGVVTLTTFFCSLDSGEVTLTEHEEVRWLAAAELNSIEWAPADIPAVRTIEKQLTVHD